MILTRDTLLQACRSGDIKITPFVEENVKANSIDVRLGDAIAVYKRAAIGYTDKFGRLRFRRQDRFVADSAKHERLEHYVIPPDGVILDPGIGYLGVTMESVGSGLYVPMLEGKSGVGRHFVSIHHTAGVGDLGFFGTWTLELAVIHPVHLYAGQPIGQFVFHTPDSVPSQTYQDLTTSRYANTDHPRPIGSKLYKHPFFAWKHSDQPKED